MCLKYKNTFWPPQEIVDSRRTKYVYYPIISNLQDKKKKKNCLVVPCSTTVTYVYYIYRNYYIAKVKIFSSQFRFARVINILFGYLVQNVQGAVSM